MWRAFGSTAFGLQVSVVVLDLIALSLCLWMAARRGGATLVIAVAAMIAVVVHAYGVFLLTWPWNAYLPPIWWMVYLLAVWSLLDGDRPMVVPAVLAGSFCVQTHISYLGVVSDLAALVVVHGAVRFWRESDRAQRVATLRWGAIGTVLGLVLWAPPIINQLTGSPGNLSILREYFTNPPSPPTGLDQGVSVLLAQMNPLRLIATTVVGEGYPAVPTGTTIPAVVGLGGWAALAVVARRRCPRSIRRLNLLVGVGLVFGLVSATRIVGQPLDYLTLWAWGLMAMALLAMGLTLMTILPFGKVKVSRVTAGVAIALVVVVAGTTASTIAAARLSSPAGRFNDTLEALTPATTRAVRQALSPRESRPFVVTWAPDPLGLGSVGWGVINELHRAGLDARAPSEYGVFSDPLRPHVMDSAGATLEVHVARGQVNIDGWRADDRSREIAFFDPRTAAQRKIYSQTRRALVRKLRREGRSRLVPLVDTNLSGLVGSGIDRAERSLIDELGRLNEPTAVFLRPKQPVPNDLGKGSAP